MKGYNINFLFLLVALFGTSCFSINQGNISSNVVEGNFTHRETAMGQARSIIILGFGGTTKNDLVNEAKRDLQAKRFLAPNERYINYAIDKQTTFYFGLVVKQLFTVHADVIAINQEADNPMSTEFKENYLAQSPEEIKMIGPIAIGKYYHFVKQNDPIYLADGSKALINDFNKREATIKYISGNTSQEKTINISEIFFEVNSIRLPALMQALLNEKKEAGSPLAQGEVIAFNTEKKFLMKSEDDKFMVID